MSEALGKNEIQAAWRINAIPKEGELLEIAHRLIEFVGMTPDPPADVRSYPSSQGRGGVGVQLYLPLVESWLIISTWPAHGFTRINLSSCRVFDVRAVTKFLGKIFKVERIDRIWSNWL